MPRKWLPRENSERLAGKAVASEFKQPRAATE
jgi:hypothetical protein